MNKITPKPGRDNEPAALRLDLLQALNAAAASLQRSSHSESEVLLAFKEQITRIGLRGGLSFLNSDGRHFKLRAVAFPQQILSRLGKRTGIWTEGLVIPLAAVENYRQVASEGQTLFCLDSRTTVRQILPAAAQRFSQLMLHMGGAWPGIYAPLVIGGAVYGILDVSGPGLTPADIPAITAFANHLAIALENAHLFQAVSRAEAQYRRLFETALEGILVLNPSTNQILSANSQAAALTGFSEAELCNLAVTALYRPEREEGIRQELAVLYRDGRHTFEVPLQRKSGEEWLAQVSAVLYEVAQQPMMQGVLRDVTAQKDAEEALRRSEEQFRVLTENAPGIIYLCDNSPDFKMHYLNPAVEKITGYAPSYFIEEGHSMTEIYHPEDAQYIGPENEATLKAKGIFQLTYRIRHASGDYRWVEDIGGGVFDSNGRLRYLAGFISDVTERIQAAEALQESQRALATLISNLPGMAYRSRNDYRFTDEFVSEGSYALTGYRPEELIGEEGISFTDLVHPDDQHIFWQETQQALATGMPFRCTYRIRTRSGEEKWVWEQGRGVYDKNGAAIALEGFITDITERKQAEELLRQAQKMESLGILAGGVAHDFNNLLAAMMGQASLARAKLAPENVARSHVDKLVKAAERASDLTRQLLAYSGRGQFSLSFLHLNTLIQENQHLLEATIPKNVRLQLALTEPLLPVEADPGQMQQVVMNLILNGAEAIGTRPGVVTIVTGIQAITSADDIYWQLTNQPLLPGRYVFLEVHDNGCGMDEATLRRIFDPFFTTKFTGRGLGLSAVLGIVRGHQGGLRVSSQPGQGSTFHLLFPGRDVEMPAATGANGKGHTAGEEPPGLVLVIDDEELIREAATDILELEGLGVVTAADG